MSGVALDFKGDPAHLERAIIKLEAEMQRLRASAQGVGAAGKKSGDDISGAMNAAAGKLVGMAAAFASISTMLDKINQAYEVWLKNMREGATEANKAVGQYVALAAMQEKGVKGDAVRAAVNLAASYGVTDRGVGLDVVQSLQSARGNRQAGLDAAAQVFAANRLGVSMEGAKEAEIIGASLGVAPGASLRRGYIAGQISPRSPEEVIKASPGLRFWQDNLDAWAAAGVISAGVEPEELGTYVRAGGIGLSGVEDKDFAKFLKKKGFAGGGQIDKLRFLASIGVDTPEEMAQAGIGEMRRQQAMAILVKNLGDFDRYRGEIGSRDRAGLFEAELGGVEGELPGAKMARQSAMVEAKYLNEKAFGRAAVSDQQEDLTQRIRGLAYERLGMRQAGFTDLIDEQGRADGWTEWKRSAWQLLGFGRGETSMANVADTMANIRSEIDQPFSEGGPRENPMAKTFADAIGRSMTEMFTRLDFTSTVRRMSDAVVRMSDAVVRMRGGPTLVPANEDR